MIFAEITEFCPEQDVKSDSLGRWKKWINNDNNSEREWENPVLKNKYSRET